MDPYTRISVREIYHNQWLAAEVHEIVHPSGAHGEHLLVVPAPAVAVLIEDGDDFVFASQPRFAARAEVLEVVKGGIETGETARDAAARELREELGLTATSWEDLGRTREIPSIVAGTVAIFLASGLTRVTACPEDVETIHAVRVPIESALGAEMSRQIEDAVTLAALYRYLMRP